MTEGEDLREVLRDLFTIQKFAVLATGTANHLRTNLIAFAATDDLKYFIFTTPKATRKYSNMRENSTISLFVDNRSNQVSDIKSALGVTVSGIAEMENISDDLIQLYLSKHPQLREFALSSSNAIIRIRVQRYDVVNGINHVTIIEVNH
jgi:general stress protein 26